MQAIYKALVLLVIASPLRAGDLDAGDHRQRPGGNRPPRHPGQGRHLPRRGAQAEGDRAGQDWHDHRGQAAAGGLGRRRFETEAAQAEHVAVVLASPPDHRSSRAIAAGLKPNGVEARDFRALAGRGVQAGSVA